MWKNNFSLNSTLLDDSMRIHLSVIVSMSTHAWEYNITKCRIRMRGFLLAVLSIYKYMFVCLFPEGVDFSQNWQRILLYLLQNTFLFLSFVSFQNESRDKNGKVGELRTIISSAIFHSLVKGQLNSCPSTLNLISQRFLRPVERAIICLLHSQ